MPDHRHRPTQSRNGTRQAWIARLERFANGALTVAAFCRREGLSVPSFYYWKRQLAGDLASPSADTARLLPVRLAPGPMPLDLLLPSGAILRLTPGCDLDFVRTVVATLGEPTC
jgi:hypothetical protein